MGTGTKNVRDVVPQLLNLIPEEGSLLLHLESILIKMVRCQQVATGQRIFLIADPNEGGAATCIRDAAARGHIQGTSSGSASGLVLPQSSEQRSHGSRHHTCDNFYLVLTGSVCLCRGGSVHIAGVDRATADGAQDHHEPSTELTGKRASPGAVSRTISLILY